MAISNREFILAVIELYRNRPCLWQVSHDDYHNKHAKDAALNELLQLFKTKDESSNLDTVKKKIASMRNCFKKEFNKVKASLKSGVAAGDIHIPKLWYYNEMLFLADVDKPIPQANAQSDWDELPFDDNNTETSTNNAQIFIEEAQPAGTSNPSTSSSHIRYSRKSFSKLKRARVQAHTILAKISKKTDAPPTPPKLKYTAYGEHIAEKLRGMQPMMATYCQKIINDAIFLAETNNLQVNSHIVGSNLGNVQTQLPSNDSLPQSSNSQMPVHQMR
ncbi:hypothetical protein ABMA27_002410 [Loxostege sticticalis]|uniref:MADF domain-containing protein n=1 Tax=Loxostege sticticalis TaxID=481309 RepID=A0ABR3HTJ6_LOXSC